MTEIAQPLFPTGDRRPASVWCCVRSERQCHPNNVHRNRTCGWKPDLASDVDPSFLQAQIWSWCQEKFPERCHPEARIVKLTEEVGEVAGAVVKIPEGRASLSDAADEIGDAAIVLMSVASALDLDYDEIVSARWRTIAKRPLAGEDSHAAR